MGGATVMALAICAIALPGIASAADTFGSYRFAVGDRAIQIPSMVVTGEQGGREAEFISLKGAARVLGGTVTALDTKGSFRLELARQAIEFSFSAEYPSIVRAGQRIVSLSRDARLVMGDLYVPIDFVTRILEPELLAASSKGAGPGAGAVASDANRVHVGSFPTVVTASGGVRAVQTDAAPMDMNPGSARSAPADSGASSPAAASGSARGAGSAPAGDRATGAATQSANNATGRSTVVLAPGAVAARDGLHTVVIDPGHGGDETGAAGKSGVLEKEITLAIAKKLKALLERDSGLKVLLTRSEDATVGLDDRTALANQNHADLFLSIHINAARRRDARGAETYFLASQAKDEEIRTLAAIENNAAGVDRTKIAGDTSGLELVLWDLAQSRFLEESSGLAEVIQKELDAAIGVRDRGIKQAPFRVLMGATMPAVLVEVGFISNPSEEAVLRTDEYRDKIAQALSRAVLAFRSGARGNTGASSANTAQ